MSDSSSSEDEGMTLADLMASSQGGAASSQGSAKNVEKKKKKEALQAVFGAPAVAFRVLPKFGFGVTQEGVTKRNVGDFAEVPFHEGLLLPFCCKGLG